MTTKEEVSTTKEEVSTEEPAPTCEACKKSLVGFRYVLRDEKPHCIECYESRYANECFSCKQKIGCESKDLNYKDKHWHEKCFMCETCKTSLADKHFASKDDAVYCADCYDEKFAQRCDGCQKVFKAGMKKFEYKGKQWHEACFLCLKCQKPIGNKSFIPRDMDVVCVPCYEEHYAQKCTACKKVINKGGVTYRGEPYHRECFVCTNENCKKELAGLKFTSKEDKPYCSDCYGELFANRCCRCSKPIVGFGGTKFISFEDRHWHADCFVCYKCNIALVGRGFLTDGSDILCPDCSR